MTIRILINICANLYKKNTEIHGDIMISLKNSRNVCIFFFAYNMQSFQTNLKPAYENLVQYCKNSNWKINMGNIL